MNSANHDTLVLQASVKKVLTSAAYSKFVTSAMKLALEDDAEPGTITLQPAGKLRVGFDTCNGWTMLTVTSDTFTCSLYQSKPGENSFKPGTWWGNTERADQNGDFWSTPYNDYVVDDFGQLVRVSK